MVKLKNVKKYIFLFVSDDSKYDLHREELVSQDRNNYIILSCVYIYDKICLSYYGSNKIKYFYIKMFKSILNPEDFNYSEVYIIIFTSKYY